jgi:hypothetical protein
LHARAEHLSAALDHFLALHWVIDDVAIFKRQIVFAHNCPNALAPTARWFQISNDLWFIHKSNSSIKCHKSPQKQSETFKAHNDSMITMLPANYSRDKDKRPALIAFRFMCPE